MINTTALPSRKRLRPASSRSPEPWCSLSLLVVLLLVSTVSSSSEHLSAAAIASVSSSPHNTKSYSHINLDDWGDDTGEDYNEDDYEDDDEWDYEEEEEILHDNWTPEELAQMDRLYERYVKQIAKTHGENWQDEFEAPVTKQQLYEEYLQYEGQKQREALERSEMTKATHQALQEQQENSLQTSNRTEDQKVSAVEVEIDAMGDQWEEEVPSRKHVFVINTGSVDGNENLESTTTIITTHGTVIGSI